MTAVNDFHFNSTANPCVLGGDASGPRVTYNVLWLHSHKPLCTIGKYANKIIFTLDMQAGKNNSIDTHRPALTGRVWIPAPIGGIGFNIFF